MPARRLAPNCVWRAGAEVARSSIGAPVGTVIAVEDLFFNLPARLKFLKSESAERSQIARVVARYALAMPQHRFTLRQEGRWCCKPVATARSKM
jgi:DNA mismatch repair protein MutL